MAGVVMTRRHREPVEHEEGQRVARTYHGEVVAGRRVRVLLPGGGHIEVGGRTRGEARRLAEAYLSERMDVPCRVVVERREEVFGEREALRRNL